MKKLSAFAGISAILIVVCLAIVPQGRSLTAQDRPRDGAVTSYLSVSPNQCQLTDKNTSTLTWYSETDEFYFSTGYPDSIWVNAPLSLPHNAAIKSFTIYCTDNGSGDDEEIYFYLQRHKMSDGTTQTMASNSTAGLASSAARKVLTDGSIDYATVDNNVYSYSIVIRFRLGHANLKFNGAKIKFTTS
jgi:hypothetical protein